MTSERAEATSERYARALLRSLGADPSAGAGLPGLHPALAWARSGAMALTGAPGGVPLPDPAALAACADGALLALRAVAARPHAGATPLAAGLRGSMLLGERAALTGLARRGSISAGGACRILPTATAPLAVNLPREEDWRLIPAWLEEEAAMDLASNRNWEDLATRLLARPAAPLLDRARLLGLAASGAAVDAPREAQWFELQGRPLASAGRARARRPLVIDLAALWAGPLCGQLLALLGCRVIKVESVARPDGARFGPPAFHDLLNGPKESVALDFATAAGRAALRGLLGQADVVIEGSRPRALRQLDIDPEALVAERPALTWLSLTGHGRGEPQGGWIAYGDDAGVAAGLSALLHEVYGEWFFCGDAIADPLLGLHAALAGLASLRCGGGRLISMSLRQVSAFAAGFELPASAAARRARHALWRRVFERSGEPVAAPRARTAPRTAPALGADTAAVLSEFGLR